MAKNGLLVSKKKFQLLQSSFALYVNMEDKKKLLWPYFDVRSIPLLQCHFQFFLGNMLKCG